MTILNPIQTSCEQLSNFIKPSDEADVTRACLINAYRNAQSSSLLRKHIYSAGWVGTAWATSFTERDNALQQLQVKNEELNDAIRRSNHYSYAARWANLMLHPTFKIHETHLQKIASNFPDLTARWIEIKHTFRFDFAEKNAIDDLEGAYFIVQ